MAKTQETVVKIMVNEDGSRGLTLPVSGQEVTMRSPKGRDLKAITLAAKRLAADEEKTELDLMISMVGILTGMSEESLLDSDAMDLEALGEALATFRVFRKSK